MISGVAQVQVYGSQKYAVRIQVDPQALASRGIGIDEVAQAIQSANVNLPTGTLYGAHQAVHRPGQRPADERRGVSAADRRLSATARRCGWRKSAACSTACRTTRSQAGSTASARWCSRSSASRAPTRSRSSTTIKRCCRRSATELPAVGRNHDLCYDRSESIRASVNDVQFTLLLTVFLVVMVIFLFLRNLSATVIPSLALPMSIIGTFAVMWALGYTLDNLSLMAITLSVGFVVDDAIVMLENIVRHMEMGKGVMEAALDGSREIGFTILSMTFSLAAVFIPVLFMGGILGRLLHEFAVTIGAAILVSGFVSLTLTPMLCSRFLRPPGKRAPRPPLRGQPSAGSTAARRLPAQPGRG